jgi:exosortase
MNKLQLPYGLRLHEVGYLILVASVLYLSDARFRYSPWPLILFGAAIAAGVGVVAARCPDEWRQIPNKLFFFGLAAVWVVLFIFVGNSTFGYLDSPSLFSWMFDVYTSPLNDEGHGVLIPFVVLALFWWKSKELVARPLGLWWPGVLIIAFALFLHLAGFLVQQQRLSVLGFLLGLYGLTGLAWGKNWLKASFFPFFLLAFCMPVGELQDGLTLPLRLMVSWIVAGVGHNLFLLPDHDLIRDGTKLFNADHTIAYDVAAACSGIRSLVALLALTTIYGFVQFKSPWKRVVMMLAAMPLAVLGNVVRLSFTIAVAEMFGEDAGKAVETKFGFITFAVALGCVLLIARWLEKSELPVPQTFEKPASA